MFKSTPRHQSFQINSLHLNNYRVYQALTTEENFSVLKGLELMQVTTIPNALPSAKTHDGDWWGIIRHEQSVKTDCSCLIIDPWMLVHVSHSAASGHRGLFLFLRDFRDHNRSHEHQGSNG
jgi:hypothetical protein